MHKSHSQLEQVHFNAFDVRYTNGYTEGCSNKAKVLKRVSPTIDSVSEIIFDLSIGYQYDSQIFVCFLSGISIMII